MTVPTAERLRKEEVKEADVRKSLPGKRQLDSKHSTKLTEKLNERKMCQRQRLAGREARELRSQLFLFGVWRIGYACHIVCPS